MWNFNTAKSKKDFLNDVTAINADHDHTSGYEPDVPDEFKALAVNDENWV